MQPAIRPLYLLLKSIFSIIFSIRFKTTKLRFAYFRLIEGLLNTA